MVAQSGPTRSTAPCLVTFRALGRHRSSARRRPLEASLQVATRADMRRGLSIGITIGPGTAAERLLSKSTNQTAIFLGKLLSNSRFGHSVRLIRPANGSPDNQLTPDGLPFPTMAFDEGCADLDVLIELAAPLSAIQTRRAKALAIRIVRYCCEPAYVRSLEAAISRRPLWHTTFINQDYDEIWVTQPVAETSLHFFQTLYGRTTKVVPFVWDPMVIENAAAQLEEKGEYRPRGGPRRLSVIEPNDDVLRFCLYPILAAEQAYRARPSAIACLQVANAESLIYDDTEFASVMQQLDIVKSDKTRFLGRVETPAFLAGSTDIVISHQWGLALAQHYLEFCWLGYPVIHNAQLVADLGYYYPGNDVETAAALLIEATSSHDVGWERYRERQRHAIGRFLPTSSALCDSYDDLLFGLNSRGNATQREAHRTGGVEA